MYKYQRVTQSFAQPYSVSSQRNSSAVKNPVTRTRYQHRDKSPPFTETSLIIKIGIFAFKTNDLPRSKNFVRAEVETRERERESDRELYSEMVKLMRKCRGADELAVLEVSHVGVITRARTRKLAMAEAKRKRPSEDLLQAKARRREFTTTPEKPENFVGVIDSRCSSNGSSELVDNVSLRSVTDLEDSHDFDLVIQNSPYRESELHSEPNNNVETAARMEDTNSCEKPSTKMEMPTDEELESFFNTAEKELKKQFSDKYNYDVEQDVPLEEGRYEWIQVKPRHGD